MTSETSELKTKLSILSDSLDDLEAKLQTLFVQTLPESIVSLDTIQQAKLQTVLPYVVYDLIFIYLKSRGVDPEGHPVFSELDRVQQYFQKIADAEDSPKKKVNIDKAAATRFIKHAITQATYGRQADAVSAAGPSQPAERFPLKVTSKMIERAEYEKGLEDADEEEEELGVFDEEDGEDMIVEEVKERQNNGEKDKGKQKAEYPGSEPEELQVGGKRRRPAIDPFAGYGDEEPAVIHGSSPDQATMEPNVKNDKMATTPGTAVARDAESGQNTPTSGKVRKSKKVKRKVKA